MRHQQHTERGAVGQVEEVFGRLDQGGELGELLTLVAREIGVFGKPAPGAQVFHDLAIGRFGFQPLHVQAPEGDIGVIVEEQAGVGAVDGDR